MSISVDFLEEEQLEEETKNEEYGIGVVFEIESGELKEWDKKIEQFVIAHTTKNGKRIYAHNVSYDPETKLISFLISQPCPEYGLWGDGYNKSIATTFVDFCWLSSDGTKPESIGKVGTPIRKDAELGDLTWALPARFCDNLVMMAHTMAEVVGFDLQEAVMYGPVKYHNPQDQ